MDNAAAPQPRHEDRPASLLDAFEHQAGWCDRLQAPFMALLMRRAKAHLAAHPRSTRLMLEPAGEPVAGLFALRLAGALHDLALQGLAPWAALWQDPLAAEAVALDAALAAAFELQPEQLRSFLASAPQTNEVQRSAVLLPGLLHVAQATGLPVHLIELGASAGLNLWCDRWRHEFGSWAWGDEASPLTLHTEWRGPLPAARHAGLTLAGRGGCDLNPIDIDVAAQRRLLQAYIWPDQPHRMVRLRTALAAATAWNAAAGLRVEQADAALYAPRELATARPGQATVVFHSVFWQYLPAGTRTALRGHIETALARATPAAPLAWLRYEHHGADVPAQLHCRLAPGGEDMLLAEVHSHGSWIEWVAR